MATLEKLRNKAGILLAVVIGIALFSFILGDFIKPGKLQGNQFPTNFTKEKLKKFTR